MFIVLVCEFISIGWTMGTRLGYPDYTSVWTLMSAQSTNKAALYLDHGLGEVPAMVEVLITPVDGPYKGFLFKATGSANRDDDNANVYGGVVYIYNDVSVVVMVPKKRNGHDSGYAIYTGDNAYWTGGSSYQSRDAYVKVRCWLLSNMPTPCYQADNIHIEAGSSSGEPTFIELNHGTGQQPELVSVRTNITNGDYEGWYSDSQGTNRYISSGNHERHGGIKYGFNDQTIRIWIPSTDDQGKYIFNAHDGWGDTASQTDWSSTGVMDVRVWCDLQLTVYTQNSVTIGPDTTNEQFSLAINALTNEQSYMDVFASITVQTVGGQNDGYFFNGIDGATIQEPQSANPCVYGGFIYSYNTQSINLRRPSQDQGAIVCIAKTNGNGMHTGASHNGVVSVKMWTLGVPVGQANNKKYKRHLDSGIDYPDIGTVRTLTSKACVYECAKRTLCFAVKYDHAETVCTMYDSFSTGSVVPETGSDVWQAV